MDTPPRGVKFCWECSRKLWGNHHIVLEVFGEDRVLHKQCADKLREEGGYEREGEGDENLYRK